MVWGLFHHCTLRQSQEEERQHVKLLYSISFSWLCPCHGVCRLTYKPPNYRIYLDTLQQLQWPPHLSFSLSLFLSSFHSPPTFAFYFMWCRGSKTLGIHFATGVFETNFCQRHRTLPLGQIKYPLLALKNIGVSTKSRIEWVMYQTNSKARVTPKE